jgi:hypothetical protein
VDAGTHGTAVISESLHEQGQQEYNNHKKNSISITHDWIDTWRHGQLIDAFKPFFHSGDVQRCSSLKILSVNVRAGRTDYAEDFLTAKCKGISLSFVSAYTFANSMSQDPTVSSVP